MKRFPDILIVVAACAGVARAGQLQEPKPAPGAARGASIVAPPAVAGAGRLEGDAGTGFRFVPSNGGPAIDLEAVERIVFDPPAAGGVVSRAPYVIRAGVNDRFAGRLLGLDDRTLKLEIERGVELAIPRNAVREIVQAAGEAVVVDDGFERLDEARWIRSGKPALGNEPAHQGQRSLRLPADGSSLSLPIAEPIAAGRFSVAYHDDGMRHNDTRALASLTFRGSNGPEQIQAVLGWDLGELAVRNRGGGPALAVQALERQRGWHVLDVEFGPRSTALSIDGNELAYGDGPGGPLVEIRLATEAPQPLTEPPVAVFDDLQLVRLRTAPSTLERDPSQDEVRLVSGDQLFGTLLSADADGVRLRVLDQEVLKSWKAATGVVLRRGTPASNLLAGLWVRLTWGTTTDRGEPPSSAEGVIVGVDEKSIRLATPYLPALDIPLAQVDELAVQGTMGRLVLDASSHHLGNAYAPQLDPPQPEGRVLELPFELAEVPTGSARLAVDVLQLIGIAGDPDFSARVQAGELVTEVSLNGDKFDQLNRHLDSLNDTPRRLELPVPDGRLRRGANVLRLELTGTKESPDTLDNFGLLGVRLEFPGKAREARSP